MKFNEFYSLTIVHSRDIILVKGVDYMNITKQKSQKTFDKQAADYDTNIQGEHARKLYKPIIENLKNEIELATKHVGQKDYKTVLQEKLQIHGDVKIEYILLNESGPDHDKRFEMEVRCNGKKLAVGTGKSKKLAQMDAAHNAIESL